MEWDILSRMQKITEVYCFVADRDDTGDEGIPTGYMPGLGAVPLVCGSRKTLDIMMELAQDFADKEGLPLKLYKFSHREQVGEVSPRG